MDVKMDAFWQALAADGFTPEECAVAVEALARAQAEVAELVAHAAARTKRVPVSPSTGEGGAAVVRRDDDAGNL